MVGYWYMYNQSILSLSVFACSVAIGKLVCIQGTVVRAGNIRPLVTHIAFQCLTCHGVQV